MEVAKAADRSLTDMATGHREVDLGVLLGRVVARRRASRDLL